MSGARPDPHSMARGADGLSLRLAWRLALRELRGGLGGFYVFLICIALGTGTIAAVNSLAYGLTDGIRAEGQSLLGGDASFSLIHRQASADEEAFLRQEGRMSLVATLRAMARTGEGEQTLVEVKGVDGAYPLYGNVDLRSGRALGEVLRPGANNGPIPAIVESTLLDVAGLKTGDRFSLGRLDMVIADVITREPDRLSGGIAFGPRVMVPADSLEASGLVDTGSLVRWHYRVAGHHVPLDDQALQGLVDRANKRFPAAGWRVETRIDAAPGLRRSIERFAQFLTLVGLTSLTVGGVGVANAVRVYVVRKRATIAILRSLGAPASLVLATYFVQIVLLAGLGIGVGLLLGALAPPIAGLLLAGLLPVSALFSLFPDWHPVKFRLKTVE